MTSSPAARQQQHLPLRTSTSETDGSVSTATAPHIGRPCGQHGRGSIPISMGEEKLFRKVAGPTRRLFIHNIPCPYRREAFSLTECLTNSHKSHFPTLRVYTYVCQYIRISTYSRYLVQVAASSRLRRRFFCLLSPLSPPSFLASCSFPHAPCWRTWHPLPEVPLLPKWPALSRWTRRRQRVQPTAWQAIDFPGPAYWGNPSRPQGRDHAVLSFLASCQVRSWQSQVVYEILQCSSLTPYTSRRLGSGSQGRANAPCSGSKAGKVIDALCPATAVSHELLNISFVHGVEYIYAYT